MDGSTIDLLIQGGQVMDGSGSPPYRADVALAGDRIVAVGDLSDRPAAQRWDAGGSVVCPGFIDVHTHDDRALLSAPEMTPKISQGVTTVITGNCGVSLAPWQADRRPPAPMDLLGGQEWYRFRRFGDYIQALERDPATVNAALLVGHSTLRAAVMPELDRPATPTEITQMQQILSDCLDQGAIGLSSGLFYPTSRAAPAAEVIELAKVLAEVGGIYTTHMRDEGDQIEESLAETFETAAAAGVKVVISHHKCTGKRNWGRSAHTLQLIDRARGRQPLGLDVYPYHASSTVLMAERIEQSTRVIVTWSEARPEMGGRDLAEIAAEWNCSLPEAVQRLQPAGAVYFQMDEADVQRILSYPHAMVGSDGLPHDQFPHPRLWGTFPRVLGHYARDLNLFSMPEAVRRMTQLPAQEFGLIDRGEIRAGAYADLVIFDPDQVIDRATFADPKQPAAGIQTVIVRGQPVWQTGVPTGARPGQVIRG